MLEIIKKCFQEGNILSFYYDKENTDSHLTGYISQYNENEVLISHITPRGEYDGYILKHIGDIYRIDYDGEYELKIKKLYQIKGQTHKKIPFEDDSILATLLDFAKINQFIVSLELEDSQIYGFVDNYNDFVSLNTVNDFGFGSGKTAVNPDKIITFAVDTDNEQDLKLLFDKQ